MLTRIRIVNIQKHKDLDLALDKINVIVGATDSGKTSVLRALTWALTNDESGENLINNDGAKECCVEVDTEVGTIKRAWSKSKNTYKLNDKEFTTFRTGVPDPIRAVVHIDDINIQRRRDMPYMVYATASDCANQFSDMMDLSEIDSVIANSNKSVKYHAEKLNAVRQAKDKITEELSALQQLDSAYAAYTALSELENKVKDCESQLNTLKNLQKRRSDAGCAFTSTIDPSEADMALQLITAQSEGWAKTYTQRATLTTLYDNYISEGAGVQLYSRAEDAAKEVERLETLAQTVRNIEMNLAHYRHIDDKRMKAEEEAISSSHALYQAESMFKAEFPDVCPLCGKERCND